MELFAHAKAVRLKSHHDKYLYADEDELRVTQDRNGSSANARWTVEPVPHTPGVVRLKSRYGRYLAASNEPFLLGMTGKKVLQAAPARPDSSVEWEPVRDGVQMRLKTRYGNYLRANGKLPPWRNTVTHDVPHRTATQEWVLWDVEIVQVVTPGPEHSESAPSSFFEQELPPELRQAPSPNTVHHRPTKSYTAQPPPPLPEYKASPPPEYKAPPPPEYKAPPPPEYKAPPPPEYKAPPPPEYKAPPPPEPKLSKLESSDSFSAPLHKVEGRAIRYHIADDKGNVDDDIERRSFTFNGSNLEELTHKLQEETGIDDIIICTRNPINGKLTPLRLQLPPNNAAMNIVLVRESSKVAETFPWPYGS